MAGRLWPPGISPSGSGLRIKIFAKGKCIHSETIPGDPYSKSHITAAKRRRDELNSRKKLGLSLLTDAVHHQGTHTFTEAAQRYLNTLDARDSTSIEYERALNRYWIPALANRLAHEIGRGDIETLLAGFVKRDKQTGEPHGPISSKTKKNILTPLRGTFQHAGITPNPADGIKPRKQQKRPIQRYRPEEREKLLATLQGQVRVFFAILFGCGLRPGEALALRWDAWDGEYLSISQSIVRYRLQATTKTAEARRVYVPTWVRPLINSLATRFAGAWMFVNINGTHYSRTTKGFDEPWQEAHKKARIPYRHPYTCRHTRAAELLSVGTDPARAAKQLGHSLQMFLNIYSEFIEEYAKQSEAVLEGAAAPGKNHIKI